MPNFKSATGSHETDVSSVHVPSSPPNRSTRFEQLKPPRIDIRKASPASSELEENISRNFIDSDMSEIDVRSRQSSHPSNRSRQTSKELPNVMSLHRSSSPKSHPHDRAHTSDRQQWSIPNRNSLPQNTLISRHEVARLRALILCSGIKAMEISRRATEPHPLCSLDSKTGLPRREISRFALDEQIDINIPQTELFPITARILSHSINYSIKTLERSASGFSTETVPALQHRVNATHDRVAMDFMDMTRRAVDEADDVSHNIVDSQRLKVKNVVDTMDKMLRRRRRRFRWVRRAGWLAVEWFLVGVMWYVWFVVSIVQFIIRVGRGSVSVVRWLLWL
jgi:hypothetical protein